MYMNLKQLTKLLKVAIMIKLLKPGNPCKVDIGAIDNGKASVSDGTYTYHGEEIRLYCDEGFVPLYAKAKTCKNGTFAPSFHQAPFICVNQRKIFL